MAYIGNQPTVGNFVKLDAITTSATATYNLTNGGVAYSPQSANHCIVSLNGVIQEPTSASNVGGFTISGSTIVFTSALTSLDVIDFILVLGDVLNIGTPSDGTVTFPKVTSNLITGATAETSIAGGDSVLIYDDSASALRKMTRTNFVAGIGATAGQVIQVLSATDNSNYSTTSTSFISSSNTMSVTITPSSASNKIFVIASHDFNNASNRNDMFATIFRDATNLGGAGGMAQIQQAFYSSSCISYLDSPSSTSAITYQLYFRSSDANPVYINSNNGGGLVCSLTAFEIAG